MSRSSDHCDRTGSLDWFSGPRDLVVIFSTSPMVLIPTVVSKIMLFATAVSMLGMAIAMAAGIGMLKNTANQAFWRNSLRRVRTAAEVPSGKTLGFPTKRRITPPPTPKMPIIAAMKGVQGPGIMKRSETTMIIAPHRKPVAGPKTKPLTKAKVSVKPTLIMTP